MFNLQVIMLLAVSGCSLGGVVAHVVMPLMHCAAFLLAKQTDVPPSLQKEQLQTARPLEWLQVNDRCGAQVSTTLHISQEHYAFTYLETWSTT